MPQLEVRASLQVEVDGLAASVCGDGDDIVVECADPARFLREVTSAALPSSVGRIDGPLAVGRLADGLHATGVRLSVTGPRGTVIALGKCEASVLGKLLTGSRHVRLGSWSATRPIVVAAVGRQAGRVLRSRRWRTASVLAAAGLVAAGRRRATDS